MDNFFKPVTVRLRKSRHANVCSKNQFFHEIVVVTGFSELRPGSNERYENSTFYGQFRFLIFILIFNKWIILYISHFIEKIREISCLYLLHWFIELFFIKYKDEYQKSKWTIECRIFISFIWSRSELWNRNNNNVFTKKRKLAWLDFVNYT